MATKKSNVTERDNPDLLKGKHVVTGDVKAIRASLSKPANLQMFSVWLVGITPLLVHAWAEKGKKAMLAKHTKAVKAGGKETRDPYGEFVSTLYPMTSKSLVDEDGMLIPGLSYGFPVTGVKNSILTAAHKDKGIPKNAVRSALWLDAEMVRVAPALAGAICDMPLVRIWGSEPEMREDMVRVGAGLNKTASMAYRAQFTYWAMRLTGHYNPDIIPDETLIFLLQEAGTGDGLGEWRVSRSGVFGSYKVANDAEAKAWDDFAAGDGKGRVPTPFGELRAAA